jgi:hypothetical protein
MTPQRQQEALENELHNLLVRYTSECDLNIGQVIGVLECAKLAYFHHQGEISEVIDFEDDDEEGIEECGEDEDEY